MEGKGIQSLRVRKKGQLTEQEAEKTADRQKSKQGSQDTARNKPHFRKCPLASWCRMGYRK
jgi:hypothetical protein